MGELSRALVVDDEEGIRFFLSETLEKEGYKVTTAANGEDALELLQDTVFDLAILDLKLGGVIDGQRVLESIRWRWPGMIVIILTAHGTLNSAVEAIQEGVDGYLLKPVRPADVRKSIEEALYRRKKILTNEQELERDENLLVRGPIRVDLERHEVNYDEQLLALSPRDFTLLVHLMKNTPQVISHMELVKVVCQYEPEYLHEAREIIKWYIHRLRKKVEPDPSNPRYIINVRGIGYRFNI